MAILSNSPRPIKGGIVLVDPESGSVLRIIEMQYNPDSISRSYQVQGVGGEAGDRLDVLRLKGPPIETIKVDLSTAKILQLPLPAVGAEDDAHTVIDLRRRP